MSDVGGGEREITHCAIRTVAWPVTEYKNRGFCTPRFFFEIVPLVIKLAVIYRGLAYIVCTAGI